MVIDPGRLVHEALPADGYAGTLVGRAWAPSAAGRPGGPAVVAIREDGVFDLGAAAVTMAELLNSDDPVALVRGVAGERLGSLADLLAASLADAADPERPRLLAPIDLQAVKACGVTFAASLLERVIEERANGDPARAEAVRQDIARRIGSDLARLRPGSPAAERLRQAMLADGAWSQYLEVGLGPDAEVFTKAQPLSAVGYGAVVGIHPESRWNNPEPELVLAVDAAGRIRGATLGNDVNLRDFEGRSALLLGKAKDNNASCAVGPWIRLLDESFGLADLRSAEIALTVTGDDGFVLHGTSALSAISRDLLDLVAQTIGPHHQYPDGLALFTGTMFAPTQDREGPGSGFTHRIGDRVEIGSPRLGRLVNRVALATAAPPWTMGAAWLMRNLVARGRLVAPQTS